MNAELQQFLAARLPFPGLAAWSVRLPDRTLSSQSYVKWLPGSRAEQILHRLALAAEGLAPHQLQAERLCWNFEQVRLHLALGKEGACLALVVQNAAELDPAKVETVLQDFQKLNPL